MTADLSASAVLAGLRTDRLGRAIEFHASLPSTNDRALDLAAGGAAHGTLVLADAQTVGRGRRGNAWHSPPGVAIHASLIVRSHRALASPTLVVAAAGLGLTEGIEGATGAQVGIKWPNDVWIGARKVAGILVEARGFDPAAPTFVVGFGINVAQSESEFPPELRDAATSLALATGRRPDRAAVLRAVLEALEPRLAQAFGDAPAAELHACYRQRSVLLGRRVALLDGDRPLEGTVADLSATDGLLLRDADGVLVHVRAGHAREVRLL